MLGCVCKTSWYLILRHYAKIAVETGLCKMLLPVIEDKKSSDSYNFAVHTQFASDCRQARLTMVSNGNHNLCTGY